METFPEGNIKIRFRLTKRVFFIVTQALIAEKIQYKKWHFYKHSHSMTLRANVLVFLHTIAE